MGEKITVSYVSLSLFVVFIVVSTLLVGLLPVYVNKPTCKTEKSLKLENTNPKIDVHKPRSKRHATAKQIETRSKLEKAFPEDVKAIQAKNPKFANIKSLNVSYCPELINPQPIKYPWYESRLPTSIYPINYDLYFLLPLWGDKSIYDGIVETTIGVDPAKPTNLIIMHMSFNEYPVLLNITDKNGKLVEMDCMGEYQENSFLILRTKNNLTSENGPYKVKLFFISSLSDFESGLFEFNFASEPSVEKKDLLVSLIFFQRLRFNFINFLIF